MPHYRILRERFRHSGERKTNGDIIELALKAADPLLAVGAVELVADDDVIIVGGGAAPMFDGLLGSPSLPLVTDLPNDDKLLAADLVRRTFEVSQLSVEEWNALPQEDRDGALVDQLDEILYGVQLKDFERDEQLQQNNSDSGDEHAPPRESITQTQPSDDKGRVEGLNTGEGSGASAPLPESSVNSEAQSSGPQTSGTSSDVPPTGEGTETGAGTESNVSDGGKADASGQPANLDAGAAAAAAPTPKPKAKPTKQSKK